MTTPAEHIWNRATDATEAFRASHGGMSWLEYERAPRVTSPASPLPPDAGTVPWETAADERDRCRDGGAWGAGGAPVYYPVPAHLIPRVAAALRNCADDLEAELRGRYGASIDKYPSEARRFERDMASVAEARSAAVALEAIGAPDGGAHSAGQLVGADTA